MTDAQTEARAIAERWWIELGFVNDRLNQTPILANLIATALAAKNAELAAANDAWRAMKDRAHAAEAQLDEANKALDRIIDIHVRNFGRQDEKIADILPIARRAREPQGE